MAILLITLAVVLRSKLNAGLLGIALVNMMRLGQSLASLISSWTSLETSLGAIARIKDFSEETPCEILEGEDVIPSLEWPAQGSFKFEGVTASYSASGSPVLKNIDLTIRPGEKIGICGRTGRYEYHLFILFLLGFFLSYV